MSFSTHLKNKVNLRVLELFEKGHTNNDILNVNIKKNILDKLLSYQTLHTFNMITAVKNNTVSIDGSYTGTGKTYTTAATCAQLGLIPFIICPKNIMSTWKNVLKLFGVNYIAVVNYESIRSCKYKDANGKNTACPYIKKKDDGGFEWDFTSHSSEKNIVIIFDEVHKCKNHKSLNGRLLLSCRERKTIMLSATLCDKKADFGIFGMMLGFYKKHNQGKSWMESIIREDKNRYGKDKINTLHKYLFPAKGSKMALEDLGDSFPMNQVSIESHNLDSDSVIKINRLYKQIETSTDDRSKIVEINDMRQKIENFKSGLLFDLISNYHEQDKSIVVFVNYVSTYDLITELLRKHDMAYVEINGKQEDDDREANIARFQNNEVRIMVSMIQAGGTTVSLHDLSGRFPRVSIISPSYSRIELIQTLGRIYRSGCKSPCLQKIIYCADTCEEDVAKVLAAKKETLDKVTEEDIDLSRYLSMKNESDKQTNTTSNNTNTNQLNNQSNNQSSNHIRSNVNANDKVSVNANDKVSVKVNDKASVKANDKANIKVNDKVNVPLIPSIETHEDIDCSVNFYDNDFVIQQEKPHTHHNHIKSYSKSKKAIKDYSYDGSYDDLSDNLSNDLSDNLSDQSQDIKPIHSNQSNQSNQSNKSNQSNQSNQFNKSINNTNNNNLKYKQRVSNFIL